MSSWGEITKQNARLALAAFPHWARCRLHMNLDREELADEMANMAQQALEAGWCLSDKGEPVAPPNWDEVVTPKEKEPSDE